MRKEYKVFNRPVSNTFAETLDVIIPDGWVPMSASLAVSEDTVTILSILAFRVIDD